jgi:hypothetical protein
VTPTPPAVSIAIPQAQRHALCDVSECKSGASTAGSAAAQTVCIHFEQLRLLSVNTLDNRRDCRHNQMLDLMALFKQRIAFCVVFFLLSFALLVSLCVLINLQGGLDRHTSLPWQSIRVADTMSRYEFIRMYGAIILMGTLAVWALSAVIILLTGILRSWRKEEA